MSPRIPSLAVQREAKRSTTRVHSVLGLDDLRDALDAGDVDLARAHAEQLHRDAIAVLDDDECARVAALRGRIGRDVGKAIKGLAKAVG